MRRLWLTVREWMSGPASKPWLIAFLVVVVVFAWLGWAQNRARITDLCEVIVLAYSQSALDNDLELTEEQTRILLPVLQQLGEGTADNQAKVLAAADCEPT